METPPHLRADKRESSLYPKITNHIKDVVTSLKHKHGHLVDNAPEEVILDPIPIVGSIKLHGTHADILVSSDNTIILQSRNNTRLRATADNHGFATAMEKKRPSILNLRDRCHVRWQELNPDAQLDFTVPITIAGEWVGENIQKGVAVANLSKRFVIISIKMSGSWVADTDYADIEAPDDGIYNISRAGFFHATLYPEDVNRTYKDLEPLAERVAGRCPFGESFGITGEGEGLVWKLVPYIANSEFWFKTKGGKFKPTFTPAPKKPPADHAEQQAAAAVVANSWCSEQRLDQGWDYLREKSIERSIGGIGVFLKWLQNDILVEERSYIEEHRVDEGMLRTEIVRTAKAWYLGRIKQGL